MRYRVARDQGVAAYRKTFGQHTFLGDPVCPSETMDSFLAELVAALPNALFMQIHQDTAACLQRLGHRITPVGVENEIDTASFSLTGKKMADLRHYRNKARSGMVTVREAPDSESLRAALRPICDAWLPQKSWLGRELEFLARPFNPVPEPDVRIFVGRIAERAVAFVVLDPMYRAGRITGYTVTILRHYREIPEGTVDYIVLHAIATLAAEGIPLLSLGVSPFHRLETLGRAHGVGSPAIFGLYRALHRWGNPIYHFKGLCFHKSRYRAREVPVFTATSGPLGLWPLYASARACRML
jgi:phosphatidylglycerol lysyltransferase